MNRGNASRTEKRWTISVRSKRTGDYEQYDKTGETLDDAKDAAVDEATGIHGPFDVTEPVEAITAGGPYDE